MRYVILAYLWAIALIAYIQRAAISVPLQEIGRDLNLLEATKALGLLQSAWHLGYALMQLPAGRLADKIGGRRTILIYAVLWSLATGLTGLAQNYWSLVCAWGLMGMLQAGAFPCAVRSIGQVFGDKERARASGWLGAGMLSGGAIAPILTAWLLAILVPVEQYWHVDRWRICLMLYAIPGLLWAVVYGLGTAHLKAAMEVSVEDSSLAMKAQLATQPTSAKSTWRYAITDWSLILLCGQQFFRAAAMVFFLTWFPTFLQSTREVSLLESGVLTSYAGVAALLGVLTGGYCSDMILAKTGNKRLARQGIAVAGMSTCAALTILSYFIVDVNLAIAVISLGAFVAAFGGVAGYTVAIDYGGKNVGTVFGAMNMCGGLGAMLFPVTVGWLVWATDDWNMALFVFAGLMALDAVLWACLNPKGKFLERSPVAI